MDYCISLSRETNENGLISYGQIMMTYSEYNIKCMTDLTNSERKT